MDYVLELDALMIALSSGDLMLLHVETAEAEDIGTIQGGIAIASWSPDGELVAVVSRTGNLILMNKASKRAIASRMLPNGVLTYSISSAGY
jgi:elongator complex protein 1